MCAENKPSQDVNEADEEETSTEEDIESRSNRDRPRRFSRTKHIIIVLAAAESLVAVSALTGEVVSLRRFPGLELLSSLRMHLSLKTIKPRKKLVVNNLLILKEEKSSKAAFWNTNRARGPPNSGLLFYI